MQQGWGSEQAGWLEKPAWASCRRSGGPATVSRKEGRDPTSTLASKHTTHINNIHATNTYTCKEKRAEGRGEEKRGERTGEREESPWSPATAYKNVESPEVV